MRDVGRSLFNTEPLIEVDDAMLDMIKQRARAADIRRFRLCLHHSPDDQVQEMIVVHCGGMYSRPHRHPGRCMSFQMIEGAQIVYLFDESGNVTGAIDMGCPGSGKTFCFRIEADRWYMPVTRSEYVVFQETLAGPNRDSEGTKYADWSPPADDLEAVSEFLRRVDTLK